LSNIAHTAFGRLSQTLWSLPGWHRVARAVNSVLLAIGMEPVTKAKLKDGSRFVVDLRAHTEWHGFYSGEYDDLWVNICQTALRPGEAFLDVGANIGIYSIRVARTMPDGCSVFSFEPFPPNSARLAENIALNGLASKITIEPFGLSDTQAEMTLTLREDFQAGSKTGNAAISISEESDGDFERTTISVKRLDDVRAELGASLIGAVKVDIEGHEDQFLRGAKASFHADRPVIVAESCRHYYASKNVPLAQAFTESLPADYRFFRAGKLASSGSTNSKPLAEFTSFDDLGALENIVLCPAEKLDRLSAFL
jgi:FkbM family methyltransferase